MKFNSIKEEINGMIYCKRSVWSKIAEIACLSGREFGADNSPHICLARNPPLKLNEVVFWIHMNRHASVELSQSSLGETSFCAFSKNDLSWSNRIFSFLKREYLVSFWYSYLETVLKSLFVIQIWLILHTGRASYLKILMTVSRSTSLPV